MKWKLSPLFIVLISNFGFTANEEKNDKECQDSFLCTPSEKCLYYQEQINEIKKTEKVETKNEILSTLR